MRSFVAAVVLLLGAATAQANTIAITEIFENPLGERTGRTWIELFNYGAAPVKLTSWKLVERTINKPTSRKSQIPSGGYIILVFGSRALPAIDKKNIFEKEWLKGVADDRVHGISSNAAFDIYTTDQIMVRNNRRQVVWSVSWKNDSKAGRASWFANEKFFPKAYGNKANPGASYAKATTPASQAASRQATRATT